MTNDLIIYFILILFTEIETDEWNLRNKLEYLQVRIKWSRKREREIFKEVQKIK